MFGFNLIVLKFPQRVIQTSPDSSKGTGKRKSVLRKSINGDITLRVGATALSMTSCNDGPRPAAAVHEDDSPQSSESGIFNVYYRCVVRHHCRRYSAFMVHYGKSSEESPKGRCAGVTAPQRKVSHGRLSASPTAPLSAYWGQELQKSSTSATKTWTTLKSGTSDDNEAIRNRGEALLSVPGAPGTRS